MSYYTPETDPFERPWTWDAARETVLGFGQVFRSRPSRRTKLASSVERTRPATTLRTMLQMQKVLVVGCSSCSHLRCRCRWAGPTHTSRERRLDYPGDGCSLVPHVRILTNRREARKSWRNSTSLDMCEYVLPPVDTVCS